jgi:hypothetical protein
MIHAYPPLPGDVPVAKCDRISSAAASADRSTGSQPQISPKFRANIIRALSSEVVVPKVPLPISNTGLILNSAGELDWNKNEAEVIRTGQLLAPGTAAQITQPPDKSL